MGACEGPCPQPGLTKAGQWEERRPVPGENGALKLREQRLTHGLYTQEGVSTMVILFFGGSGVSFSSLV